MEEEIGNGAGRMKPYQKTCDCDDFCDCCTVGGAHVAFCDGGGGGAGVDSFFTFDSGFFVGVLDALSR